MISIRRVASSRPFTRLYELRLEGEAKASARPLVLRRGLTVRRLDGIVGVGDAWTLIRAADDAFTKKGGGWVSLLEDEGS